LKQLLFLRVYKGTDLVLVKQTEEPPVVLGRGGDVTIRLDADGISPIHAMIEDRDGKFFLCDLGSESGTFKNNESILDDEIKSGDEVRIGPFRIEFFIGLPKPKAPPPEAPPKVEKKPEAPPAKLVPPEKPKSDDSIYGRELPKTLPASLATKKVEKPEPKVESKPEKIERPATRPAPTPTPKSTPTHSSYSSGSEC